MGGREGIDVAPILKELHALVDGLPDGRRLLVAALDDLADPTGIPTEDVAAWWREALVAYRADPTPAVADRILMGERVGGD